MKKLQKKKKTGKTNCPFCKQTKKWEFKVMDAGREKLIRFCCLAIEEKKEKINFAFHRFSREPVAFGHDKKTGKPWAIDKKGKRFDPFETRYAQHPDDQFGWKATGKVKPKKTYHI